MFAGLKQYLPVLGMVLATLLSTFYVALGDEVISPSEWFMVTTSFLGAVTTYVVPRFNEFAWLKTIVSAFTLAVTAAGAAFITNGISSQEWMMIATQFLVGLGIVVGTQGNVPKTPAVEPPLAA